MTSASLSVSAAVPGPPARFLLRALRAYQGYSSTRRPSCRFEPSCSNYAVEAVARHGAARGSWLAARRVLRCQPFARGGWDPVPEASGRSHPVASAPSVAAGELRPPAVSGARPCSR